ncbi:MAG: hypothetical protein WAP51_04440 [Candidatus Sungiibacteriota bacterium]
MAWCRDAFPSFIPVAQKSGAVRLLFLRSWAAKKRNAIFQYGVEKSLSRAYNNAK